MLNITKTFVIKNPAGTYSYVGRVPSVLGREVEASKAAVVGGRSFKNVTGALVEVKFPVFPTEAEAIAHAASHGVEVQS